MHRLQSVCPVTMARYTAALLAVRSRGEGSMPPLRPATGIPSVARREIASINEPTASASEIFA